MKKITSLMVGLALLMSLMVTNAYALSPANYFDDVAASHSNSEAIGHLKSEKIVEGYKDGSYKPDTTINRAEFIKIASLMITGGAEAVDKCVTKEKSSDGKSVYFPDVPMDIWFAKYVCLAKDKGLIKGYDDGMYHPDRDISFSEASKIILKVFEYKADESGATWYENYLKKMEELKSIPSSIANPHHKITRGEMAELIWRIAKKKDLPTQTAKELEEKLAKGTAVASTVKSTTPAVTEDFPKIASCKELSSKIEEHTKSNRYYSDDSMEIMPLAAPMMKSAEAPAGAVAESSTDSSVSAGAGSSSEFSQTNIQVAGVDEADIIKNDGQYIYMVRKDTVRIVKAHPVENMVELSKLTFKDGNFNPSEIYLYEDNLVVIGNTYMEGPAMNEARELMPWDRGTSRTKAIVIDVKDRKDPKKLREVSLEGNYSSSRRIGDYVYLVLNKYPNYYYPVPLVEEGLVPRMMDSKVGEDEVMVGCSDIHYFPGYSEPNYLIVAAIPVKDMEEKVKREVMLGASENIYSSQKNLYVASTDYNYNWEPVLDIVGDEVPEEDENEKTVVYKFSLDKGVVKFTNKGKVPGKILNQFSMDEYSDHFRIATTIGDVWNSKTPSTNNVYILDGGMKIVGKLEAIAPGERIYSTRFMGKRGYMVTFKKVDPLFVFDLSDPKNPKILGKLKIPGFSDYLHPYDENHIIGFGKDTVEASEDETSGRGIQFAWYQGFKMAVFDITDVEEPKQKFVEVIGDRGTDSELLRNHKALLFDKSKNLLAFPISVAKIQDKENVKENSYGETVFQGAYVYDIDMTDGFKLRGKVSHYDDPEVFTKSGDYFYGTAGLNIKRMIYIGDYLYSISDDMIKGLSLDKVVEKNKVTIKD